MWAIGNVAGDNIAGRDEVLAVGGVPAVVAALGPIATARTTAGGAGTDSACTAPRLLPSRRQSCDEVLAFTLSNCCRGKPKPAWSDVEPALPCLILLLELGEGDAQRDAVWGLSCACLRFPSNERLCSSRAGSSRANSQPAFVVAMVLQTCQTELMIRSRRC